MALVGAVLIIVCGDLLPPRSYRVILAPKMARINCGAR